MIEDNKCPNNYPIFGNSGIHADLLVDKDTYIVDRDGRVCISQKVLENISATVLVGIKLNG